MNPVFFSYLLLAIAIISEVIGTTFLVKSEGFTKLGPTLAVALFYPFICYLKSLKLSLSVLLMQYGVVSVLY